MRTRHRNGFTLAETLVALTLNLVLMAAALPALLALRRLAVAAAADAGQVEGLRVAALRLAGDGRRAGHGLPGPGGVALAPGEVRLAWACCGPGSGIPVRTAVPAGARNLELTRLDGLRPGSPVILREPDGSAWSTVIESTPGAGQVVLADPLPWDGTLRARVHPVEEVTWEGSQRLLRRRGQTLLEGHSPVLTPAGELGEAWSAPGGLPAVALTPEADPAAGLRRWGLVLLPVLIPGTGERVGP